MLIAYSVGKGNGSGQAISRSCFRIYGAKPVPDARDVAAEIRNLSLSGQTADAGNDKSCGGTGLLHRRKISAASAEIRTLSIRCGSRAGESGSPAARSAAAVSVSSTSSRMEGFLQPFPVFRPVQIRRRTAVPLTVIRLPHSPQVTRPVSQCRCGF